MTYRGNADTRKRRLVRAYLRASRAGDVARIAAVRKAFWALVDATHDQHYKRGAWSA